MDTIGERLSLAFTLILLVLVGYGVVSYVGLDRVDTAVSAMEADSMLAMEAAHLQRLSDTVLLPVHDFLLTGNPAARQDFEDLAAQLDAVLAGLGAPSASEISQGMAGHGMEGASPADADGQMETSAMVLALAPEELDLLREVSMSWTRVRTGAEQIFEAWDPGESQQAIDVLADLEPQAQRMAAFGQSLHQGGMRDVRLSRESVDVIARNTSLSLIAAVLIAIGLSVLLTGLMSRAITRPIGQLTQLATTISLGDLDAKVNLQAKGEVGDLAQAIERMRTSLKMTIDRLSEEEEELRTWTSHLLDREIRRKVRGGTIALGGQRYEVGRELDGQSVFVKLDLDVREIIVTPASGTPRRIPLRA